MEEIDRIRQRIHSKGKEQKQNSILRILSIFCVVSTLVLGFMIYAKKDEEGKFIKDHFNLNISFTNFNTSVSNLFSSLFVFNSSKSGVKSVANNIVYVNKGNNLYCCEGNSIQALKSGVVLYCDVEQNGSYTVIINYENNIIATYFNLVAPIVKVYDQIKVGDTIAYYDGDFKVLFKKENNLITYDEAIQ